MPDSEANLQRQLNQAPSIAPVLPTSPSFAEQNAPAQNRENPEYRKIGAGACGVVFAHDGTSMIIKLAKAADDTALWRDYTMHTLIAEKFKEFGTDIKVPECYGFVQKGDQEFWDANPAIAEAAGAVCNLPTNGLYTERIPPLTVNTRKILIERYCTERGKAEALSDPANRDCLARLYLGSLHGRGNQMCFSLRNFELHLNQIMGLQLNVYAIAGKMGRALSIMHWAAKVDARGVELVLGGSDESFFRFDASEVFAMPINGIRERLRPGSKKAEDFRRGRNRVWLLDFNQVQPITMDDEGVAQAVTAFNTNDPYFPRPLQEGRAADSMWTAFSLAYLETSEEILQGGALEFAEKFIRGVIEMEKKEKKLAT